MRNLFLITALATLIFHPNKSHGQDCESLILLSKVVSETVENSESIESHAANFCSEYYKSNSSARSSSFGASYKFLAANSGRSRASAEEIAAMFCSSTDTGAARKDAYRQYVETISPNSYSAYEECLKMRSQNGLEFSIQPATVLPQEFTMHVKFKSPNADDMEADIVASPSQRVVCEWNGHPGQSLKIKTGSTASLKCLRSDQSKSDYVAVSRSDGTEDPLSIPWQPYSDEGIPVNSLRALQEKIAEMDAKILEDKKAIHGSIDVIIESLRDEQLFGGIFVRKEPNCGTSGNLLNPMTGGLSCPTGFKETNIGRIWHPETRCGVNQFLCTKTIDF